VPAVTIEANSYTGRQQTHMKICDQIRRERSCGSTRCGIADGALSISEAARAFGLVEDSTIYRPIGRDEADAIAAHILQAGLAHGLEIMSSSRAVYLWQQFMAQFDEGEVNFVTNAAESLNAWTPATDATFDMGVLVFGASKVGCLWVEDED
jgi:hypothetical protein